VPSHAGEARLFAVVLRQDPICRGEEVQGGVRTCLLLPPGCSGEAELESRGVPDFGPLKCSWDGRGWR